MLRASSAKSFYVDLLPWGQFIKSAAQHSLKSGLPMGQLQQRNYTLKSYLWRCLDADTWLTDIVPRTALAVLWLAMHQVNVDSMVALTLAEAAEVSGRWNWSLILLSSARVSRVMCEAVIVFLLYAACVPQRSQAEPCSQRNR